MANKNSLEECTLCQEHHILKNSHYMPAFAFRRVKNQSQNATGKPVGLIKLSGIYKTERNDPGLITKRALCLNCEKLFNNSGEAHVARDCFDGDKFELRDKIENAIDQDVSSSIGSYIPAEIVEPYDWKNWRYFAASVIWRGSAIQFTEDQEIYGHLGKYQQSIAAFLLGHAPFPDGVYFSIDVLQDISQNNGYLAYPNSDGPVPLSGFTRFLFDIPGISVRCFVGNSLPEDTAHRFSGVESCTVFRLIQCADSRSYNSLLYNLIEIRSQNKIS